ncbi:hypothetical protein JQ580_24065 [Bradyrhizobium japonicum]|uniref:hypothetical protein n=1 Tax=Bradyrhizobium japonicum TaxID=375 RepID=UPI001BA99F9D|nr:hypothetical protein [Bradyrhizobium japonicum]MBR0993805.1 hypothetical protein [Bradyrhizobium japonicum]
MGEPRKERGLFGLVASNLDTIAAVVKFVLPASFTGAVVGWATWFAGLFQQYAPASWVIAGVLGAWFGAGIIVLAAIAREKLQLIKFRNNVFAASQINPLDQMFTGRRLRLVDLAPPVGAFIDNKTFTDCEFIGPANVMFQGCNFLGSGGEVVDGIVIKPGFLPSNGFGFRNCTFTRCKFYLMTFMVPEPDFAFFNTTHAGLNWITEKPDEPSLRLPPVTPEKPK